MASQDETQAFGPDIVVPEEIKALTVWAEVSSTDDTGVTIDGVKAGDVVEVSEVTGICSFDDGSAGQKISGFVAIVGGILATGLPLLGTAAALKVAKAFGDRAAALKKGVGTPGTAKRRDGYGEDPRTSDFATREGGIIVCMPSAKGVLYATEENYLAAGPGPRGDCRTISARTSRSSTASSPVARKTVSCPGWPSRTAQSTSSSSTASSPITLVTTR